MPNDTKCPHCDSTLEEVEGGFIPSKAYPGFYYRHDNPIVEPHMPERFWENTPSEVWEAALDYAIACIPEWSGPMVALDMEEQRLLREAEDAQRYLRLARQHVDELIAENKELRKNVFRAPVTVTNTSQANEEQ